MLELTQIQKELFAMQDMEYRSFHARLMPSVKKEYIIGVRTPELRKYAKNIFASNMADSFMNTLPHTYYEENNLHAFLIEQIADFDELIAALDVFLPYVNNWATCDMMRPKLFKKNKKRLLPHLFKWMTSGQTYTVRFGIGMLMKHFLDADFEEQYLYSVASIESDEYYVKMMQAWFFATAFAKQWGGTVNFIKEHPLPSSFCNMMVQKAVESRCLEKWQKEQIRMLKI